MAIPTFVAAGTESEGLGSATLTPGLPTGHTADDILLLVMECDYDGAPTPPTGFVAVTDSPQATSAGNQPSQLNVWWKRDSGSESALSFTGPLNHAVCRVYAFRDCATTGNPWDVTSGGVNNTQGTSISVPGDTTTVADCRVVVICSDGDDRAADHFSSIANADLASLSDHGQGATSLGNGGGFFVASGGKATAGAYGATTATAAGTAKQAFMTIALSTSGTQGGGTTTEYMGEIPI